MDEDHTYGISKREINMESNSQEKRRKKMRSRLIIWEPNRSKQNFHVSDNAVIQKLELLYNY